MNVKNKWHFPLAIMLVVSADHLLLYYLKYHNQSLSLGQFSLLSAGNVLNLITWAILAVSLVFFARTKSATYLRGRVISITIVLTLMLLIAWLLSASAVKMPGYYLLGHPLKETVNGIFFSAFQFSELLLISVIWIALLGRKELLILRGTVNSVFIAIFLLAFAFISLNSSKENALKKGSRGNKKYVGVVLGAAVWSGNKPGPSLAARTEKAAELYREGILSKIQLTGGHAPGEMSESEVAYRLLEKLGVKKEDIWIEKKTTSTIEQIRFIKRVLIGAKNIKNILIISDGFHLKRVNEICDFYKIKVKVASSGLNPRFESRIYYKLRESIALIVFWFFAI